MNEITTTDFSKFGFREREMAEELLVASRKQGFPDQFYDSGTTIMFNTYSGNVFFTNDVFQVCMMNGDDLEMFYSCPDCGEEGFAEELFEYGNECCLQYLKDSGEDIQDED